MWYVVQVFAGEEEKIKRKCRQQISPDILVQCFIPYYEEQKRYLGEWHLDKKILFPGYVFVITEQIQELYKALKKMQGFSKILGDKEYLTPLSEGEVAFLKKFGGEDQVVGLSVGLMEKDKIKILDGPLMGLEGCIRKIDRHKRRAWIQVEMFGKIVDAMVGLEVVTKK